ncbi:MAG: ATP-binding protein [Acidobacteriota bacterium]
MDRILILMDQKENSRLLGEWLSRMYDVTLARGDAALDEPFDLCVVDGLALDRLWGRIEQRKKDLDPVFLPFLLVASRQDVTMATRHLWREIDELILMPIEKIELQARVEILLRARRYSLESEQRYYSLAQESPAGVFILQNNRFVYANPIFAEIIDQSLEPLDIEAFMNLCHPEDRRKVRNHCGFGQESRSGSCEIRLKASTGRTIWLELRTSPIGYRSAPALLGIAHDISERKCLEDTREKNLECIKTLIDLSEDALAERTVQGLMDQVVAGAGQLTEANLCAVVLAGEDGVPRIAAANEALRARGLENPFVARTVREHVLRTPESLRLSREELREREWSTDHGKIEGLLAVPLRSEDGERMAIMVSAKKGGGDFSAEDEALLKQLASLASLGLRHIEARDRAEQRAEELDAVLSSLISPVLVYDAQGKTVRATPLTHNLCGFDPTGMDLESFAARVEFRNEMGATVDIGELPAAKALHGEATMGERFHFTNADGRTTVIIASASPIVVAEKITGAVSIWHDVTERDRLFDQVNGYAEDLARVNEQLLKKTAELMAQREALREAHEELEARVRERTEELRRSNQALQEFASIASHDLQEPLRKVQSFGGRIKERYAEELGETGRDYLERMLGASRRMEGLIHSLLSYSRVATRGESLVPVDLGEVVREVMGDLEVRIEQTRGQVEIGELPTLDADPNQMRQLFQNLLGNALKFHREGVAPVVKVRHEAGETPGWLRVIVEDNGIGFEEEYVERIFAPFQRLHGRDSGYEGTGMGLAICKRIVERHGGDISAESRLGQGSAFIIRLPEKQKESP